MWEAQGAVQDPGVWGSRGCGGARGAVRDQQAGRDLTAEGRCEHRGHAHRRRGHQHFLRPALVLEGIQSPWLRASPARLPLIAPTEGSPRAPYLGLPVALAHPAQVGSDHHRQVHEGGPAGRVWATGSVGNDGSPTPCSSPPPPSVPEPLLIQGQRASPPPPPGFPRSHSGDLACLTPSRRALAVPADPVSVGDAERQRGCRPAGEWCPLLPVHTTFAPGRWCRWPERYR